MNVNMWMDSLPLFFVGDADGGQLAATRSRPCVRTCMSSFVLCTSQMRSSSASLPTLSLLTWSYQWQRPMPEKIWEGKASGATAVFFTCVGCVDVGVSRVKVVMLVVGVLLR